MQKIRCTFGEKADKITKMVSHLQGQILFQNKTLMSSLVIREREQDDADLERYAKRVKTDGEEPAQEEPSTDAAEHILPPSHALLGIPLPVSEPGKALNFLEIDVGISEYIGRGEAKVEGIIKQR